MNININISSIPSFAKKHFSILLGLSIIVIILFEAFVVKRSADFVLRVKNQVPNVQTRIVRVNLPMYAQVEKVIEDSRQFEASNIPAINPFGLAPSK